MKQDRTAQHLEHDFRHAAEGGETDAGKPHTVAPVRTATATPPSFKLNL